MNEIAEKDVINIENKIYEIDGKEVMLDTDLAELYNVETKRINEAVKNNPEKFPKRYLFRITDKEYDSLKSKISTSIRIMDTFVKMRHYIRYTDQ